MAGDWLAACKDLPEKPEVIALANQSGEDRLRVAAFLVFRFWSWADGQTEDGFIPGCTVLNLVEMFTRPESFWLALVQQGWLALEAEGIRIPNFRRWMGKSAKNRLAKNARQAKWRSPGEKDGNVDGKASTKAPTTEPNRTEPNHQGDSPPETPDGLKPARKPKTATTARKPRERDELFDTLAEITSSDPVVSGSHIGRVCTALRSADPPYTSADLRRFVEIAPTELAWLTGRITLGIVEKYIGCLRSKTKPQEGKRGSAQPSKRYDEARDAGKSG